MLRRLIKNRCMIDSAAQIVSRMSNLADVIWNNAPKSILDPFPAQVQGAKSVY